MYITSDGYIVPKKSLTNENIKKINLIKVSSIAFQRLIFETKKNPLSFT